MEEHTTDGERGPSGGESRARSARLRVTAVVVGLVLFGWTLLVSPTRYICSPITHLCHADERVWYVFSASSIAGGIVCAFGLIGTRQGKRFGPLPAVVLSCVLGGAFWFTTFWVSFLRDFTF